MYQQAPNLRIKEERVVSTDEMTGIQALERKAPDKPMKPGQSIKREFEYLRHGTQTLIASFDVSSGKIIQESIGKTRTESDFVNLSHYLSDTYLETKNCNFALAFPTIL